MAVHNLQSQSGGGILDPDDRLNDVADDREQIIANFEDGDGVHHGGGDGASGSSVGTGSPDLFHVSPSSDEMKLSINCNFSFRRIPNINMVLRIPVRISR